MTEVTPELVSQPALQRRSVWSAWIVVAAVVLVLGRLSAGDFTYWDDQQTIYANGFLNPPRLETLRFYWTTPESGLFVPITYTLWALIAKIAYIGRPDQFGIMLNPWPFHAANVLVHLASSLLVLRLLRRLVGAEVPALLGTLLFALHPVQVETIGWVSGFKDLLCWCFGLASVLLAVRRIQTIEKTGAGAWSGWEMWLSLLLLVTAILSKPTAIVLPAAIWIIDGLLLRKRWVLSLVQLWPFFLVTLAGAAMARAAQYVGHVPAAPLWARPFIAGDSLAFYIRKLVWPATLTFDYGRTPAAAMSSPWIYAWWLVPAALLVVAWLRRDRAPVLLAAFGLFVIGVAPVAGITTFMMQSYSTVTDHYLYFSLVGPALLLAWTLARWPLPALRFAAAAIVIALGVRSFVQTAVWHDSYSLFEHGRLVNPRSFVTRTNLAIAHIRSTPSRPDLADRYVEEAYAIDPHQFYVLSAYASVKAMLGQHEVAIRAYEECYRVMDTYPGADRMKGDFAAGVAANLITMGEPEAALRWANEALRATPDDPHAIAALSGARNALKAKAATQPATTAATTAAKGLPPASRPAPASGRD